MKTFWKEKVNRWMSDYRGDITSKRTFDNIVVMLQPRFTEDFEAELARRQRSRELYSVLDHRSHFMTPESSPPPVAAAAIGVAQVGGVPPVEAHSVVAPTPLDGDIVLDDDQLLVNVNNFCELVLRCFLKVYL